MKKQKILTRFFGTELFFALVAAVDPLWKLSPLKYAVKKGVSGALADARERGEAREGRGCAL